MAFFSKKEVESPNVDRDAKVRSVIGKDMRVVGDVSFKGKMRLDGKTEGNINGEYLILGESGTITGDVAVDVFVCSGHVKGNINVKKMHVFKGGTINGKVETTDLEVESGAILNGEVKSRSKDIRLVPGSSIPAEEWEEKVKAASKSPTPSPAKAST